AAFFEDEGGGTTLRADIAGELRRALRDRDVRGSDCRGAMAVRDRLTEVHGDRLADRVRQRADLRGAETDGPRAADAAQGFRDCLGALLLRHVRWQAEGRRAQ